MMRFLRKNHQLLFYIFWVGINLVQAGTTELFDDEAYYWVYSKYPAWGYFDHPPMVSWLIQSGYWLFHNEFGLRLFIVLLNGATLFLIQQLIARKNDFLFYGIAFCIAVAQIGGIIAVPDLPLLFFVALYFVLFRRFINNQNLSNTILLSISVALMVYSKYHGLLIVLASLIAVPRLFSKYQTYLVAGFSLLLFFPHLYWQYKHGFPSVQFHLFERSAVHYRFSFTTEYLLGQLALAGPLLGWLFLWSAFRYKPASDIERALKFSLIGVYLVFLISTFKGRTEANWTIPAFVSLIVLSHQYILANPRWIKWVYWGAPISFALVLGVRIFMGLDLPVSSRLSKDEFHENREAVSEIEKLAGQNPVVVIDSYQKPSKFYFYSGKPAMALNTPFYRRNNYNFWPIEDSLIGKPAMVIGPKNDLFNGELTSTIYKNNGYRLVDIYFSFSRILFQNIAAEVTDSIRIKSRMDYPENYRKFLAQTPYDTCQILLALYDDRGDVFRLIPTHITLAKAQQQAEDLRLAIPQSAITPGRYNAKLAISSCLPGYPSVNSTVFKVTVR